ncbi:MAG: ABC transporter permease subunit [Actinomycetota bacterium]
MTDAASTLSRASTAATTSAPATGVTDDLDRRGAGSIVADLARMVWGMIVALAALLVVWVAFLRIFDVNAFVGVGPVRVWNHLVTDPDAAEHRTGVIDGLGRTLLDAGSGLIIGGATSIAVACLFVLYKPLERALLPIGVAFQTVPIVALVPLLALLFGRGLVSTIIVTGIIVFFPTLVFVTHGLRSVSPQSVELMRVYNAGELETLLKLRLPSALPSIFAAAKIAVPGSILGALLAEWLVTGTGLGYEMLISTTRNEYPQLWAATATLTAFAIIVYTLTNIVERIVLARFAPEHVTL